MSTDYSPALLTAWGYRDCKRDPHNGGFGSARKSFVLVTITLPS